MFSAAATAQEQINGTIEQSIGADGVTKIITINGIKIKSSSNTIMKTLKGAVGQVAILVGQYQGTTRNKFNVDSVLSIGSSYSAPSLSVSFSDTLMYISIGIGILGVILILRRR